MKLNSSEKTILLSLFLGILLVIITIFILYNIWGNSNTNREDNTFTTSKELKIGEYVSSNVTNKIQAQKYGSIIKSLFLSQDIQAIFNCLDESYIKYYNITKESLEEKLMSKNIIGKNLNLVSYKRSSYKTDNIYVITLGSDDLSISIDTVVIEKSPNEYKLAFDNFVNYSDKERKFEESDLIFNIKNQLVYTDSYKLEVKITNKGNKNIIINKNNNYEVIYLRTTSNNEIATSSTVLAGKKLNVTNRSEYNFKLSFRIPNLRLDILKGIVIKNVMIDNKEKDIEFKL